MRVKTSMSMSCTHGATLLLAWIKRLECVVGRQNVLQSLVTGIISRARAEHQHESQQEAQQDSRSAHVAINWTDYMNWSRRFIYLCTGQQRLTNRLSLLAPRLVASHTLGCSLETKTTIPLVVQSS